MLRKTIKKIPMFSHVIMVSKETSTTPYIVFFFRFVNVGGKKLFSASEDFQLQKR